jgi:hypothetical protein
MNEITLQFIVILKLTLLVVFAALYGFGGINGKWKRRIIAPIVLTAGLIGLSLWQKAFSWWYISYALLLYGGLSIGYGADSTKEKIIKRSRYGLVLGLTALPIAIVNAAWAMLGLHIFLCVLVSTILGVWNITPSARAEESIIGFTAVFLPIFMF